MLARAINQQTYRMQQSATVVVFVANSKLYLSLFNWLLLSLLHEYHFLMFGNWTVSSFRQYAHLLHNVSALL